MEIKKGLILPLVSLIFIFGFLGVVSAATSIDLTFPDGEEFVSDGVIITWDVTGSESSDRFDVRYSPNGGESWTTIVETLFHTSRSQLWDTTSTPDGTNYLIQVVETGSSPGAPDDVSNSVFTVDNNAPTSSADSLSTFQNTVTFDVPYTATDSASGVKEVELFYKKDGGSLTSYGVFTSSPISFDSSTTGGDGNYDFHTIATDNSGNIESAPGSADASTIVDTVDPTTSDNYAFDDEWVDSDQTITLTQTDPSPSSVIEWTRYCLTESCDPVSGITYVSSVPITAEGTTHFRYASKDFAGNVQNTQEKTVKIDKTDPTASVSGAPSGLIVDADGVTATISCTDGVSDCSETKYKVYTTDPGASCSPGDLGTYISGVSVSITGHSWVCAYATDNAENDDFSDPVEFNVFSIIQDAIDAASPSDTIEVVSDSYPESILIDKSLTLVGTGVTKPVISGDDSIHNYIVKITADGVVFDNFEVNGSGLETGDNVFDYGIWLSSTDNVEIKNSDVKNVWKNQGNGIQVDDSTNSDINNNTISSFQKRGIRYLNSDGIFYDNEVVGDNVDGTSRVQNLVNVFDGSNVEIYGNELHNALSTDWPPTWDSPGIFVSSFAWDSSEADSHANIHDNEIYDSDSAIVITSVFSTTDSSSAVMTNNNIHDNVRGLVFERTTGTATLSGNTFTNNIDDFFHVAEVDGTGEFYGGIQPSINAASSEAIINIYSGEYEESLTINKKVTLQENSEAIINGTHTITSSDVTLDGFTFNPSSGVAITIDSSSSAINNVQILNSVFDLTTDPSIGVWIGGGTPTNKVSNIVMNDNVFNGPTNMISNPWKIGGSFGFPLNTEVESLDFKRNTVNKGSIPINLQNSNLIDILINDNTFRDTDGVAYVWTQDASAPSGILSDFVFTNNDVDSTNNYGVAFFDTNVGGADPDDTLTDSNFGLGNRINLNKLVGIPGAYGLKSVSILKTSGSYVLDAEDNWWGDLDPSDQLVGDVDFTPWAYDAGVNTDHDAPTSTVNSPAESSWQNSDFNAELEYSDTGGAGLADGECKYKVVSNGTITEFYKSAGSCSGNNEIISRLITVGSGSNCRDEGTNICEVFIKTEDNSGNEGTEVSRTFNIDFTDPTGSVSIEGGALYTGNANIELGLTFADNLDTELECRFSNDASTWSSWEACTTSKTRVLTAGDGSKTVYLEVRDDAGNVDQFSDDITLDTTPPEITHTQTITKRVVGDSTEITATIIDSGSGVASATLHYTVDGVGGTDNTPVISGDSYTFTILASTEKGTVDYHITAEDNAGKTQTSSTFTITVNDLIWELDSSWNLVSVPKTLVENVTNTLLPINAVWEYNGNVWARPVTIEPGIGYWVDNATLTILGLDYSGDCTGPFCLPSGKINIDALEGGWNLIGLTSTEEMNVSSAFSSIFDEPLPVFSVIRYDESLDKFELMVTSNLMNPGEGYWVYIFK